MLREKNLVGQLQMIRTWCEIMGGAALEWFVAGRTYQVSGNKQVGGFYERFFHEDFHPTRRALPLNEMVVAFESAAAFEVYGGMGPLEKGKGAKLSHEQVLDSVTRVIERQEDVRGEWARLLSLS